MLRSGTTLCRRRALSSDGAFSQDLPMSRPLFLLSKLGEHAVALQRMMNVGNSHAIEVPCANELMSPNAFSLSVVGGAGMTNSTSPWTP